MKHVFVETNWIVDAFRPRYKRTPESRWLLDLARRGAIRLFIPSISLREGERTIREKFASGKLLTAVREYRRWARDQGSLPTESNEIVSAFLAKFDQDVRRDLDALSRSLDDLRRSPGVEVFALNEAMFDRAIGLRSEVPGQRLQPFDESILAAVLVRAEELRSKIDVDIDIAFCTLDGDLNAKKGGPLAALYSAARIAVQPTFVLKDLPPPPQQIPARPIETGPPARSTFGEVPGYWFSPNMAIPASPPQHRPTGAILLRAGALGDVQLEALDLVSTDDEGAWRPLSHADVHTYVHSADMIAGRGWRFVPAPIEAAPWPLVYDAAYGHPLDTDEIRQYYGDIAARARSDSKTVRLELTRRQS